MFATAASDEAAVRIFRAARRKAGAGFWQERCSNNNAGHDADVAEPASCFRRVISLTNLAAR
jgi:hypothetical protein